MFSVCHWSRMISGGLTIVSMCVALLLGGCGGGGGVTAPGTSSTSIGGQAVLGPLSGASISISTAQGNIVATGTTQTSNTMTTAGAFSFSVPAANVSPIYLITVRGGTDIDPTDSGTAGAGVASKGVFHAYVTDAQAKAGKITVNPLTEIIYQDIALQYPGGVSALTSAQWVSLLDVEAKKFLTGAVSYSDVLAFLPSRDKVRSKVVWSKILAKLVKGIHDGDDGAAMLNRVSVLKAALQPVGTTLSPDGNTIERLADAGGDRVRTDVAKNAAGQVDVLEQKYVDISGAVVLVRATRMNASQSYLNASVSKAGHTLSFEGATTLLNGKTFGTANMAQFASNLVSITAPDTTSLDITLDKSLATRISANELVFTIDGREPDATELNVLLDDPMLSWIFTQSSAGATTLAGTLPNFPDITVHRQASGNTVVFEMPLARLNAYSGLAADSRNVAKEGLSSVLLDATLLLGPTGPVTKVFGLYSAFTDLQLLLGSGIKNTLEAKSTSTRTALIGNFNNGKIIPFESYVPVIFFHSIDNFSILPSLRSVDLSFEVSAQASASYPQGSYLSKPSPASLAIGTFNFKHNMGYVIIPNKSITFSESAVSGSVFYDRGVIPKVVFKTTSGNTRVFSRTKELQVDINRNQFNALKVIPNFQYSSDQATVTLNASPTISTDGVIPDVNYVWSVGGTQIGTGKVLSVSNNILDPNNDRSANVTLNVTSSTGITGSQTKTIKLATRSWSVSTFSDSFASLDTNSWDQVNNISGSWSASNGVLTGSFSGLASGQDTDQANLLLKTLILPQGADFSASFIHAPDASFQGGWFGQRFVLYNSAGNKYNIILGPVGVVYEVRQNSNTTPVGTNYPVNNINCFQQTCTVHLVKSGNKYSIKYNGIQVFSFTDNIWNGNTRFGLGSYGLSKYGKFTLYRK